MFIYIILVIISVAVLVVGTVVSEAALKDVVKKLTADLVTIYNNFAEPTSSKQVTYTETAAVDAAANDDVINDVNAAANAAKDVADAKIAAANAAAINAANDAAAAKIAAVNAANAAAAAKLAAANAAAAVTANSSYAIKPNDPVKTPAYPEGSVTVSNEYVARASPKTTNLSAPTTNVEQNNKKRESNLINFDHYIKPQSTTKRYLIVGNVKTVKNTIERKTTVTVPPPNKYVSTEESNRKIRKLLDADFDVGLRPEITIDENPLKNVIVDINDNVTIVKDINNIAPVIKKGADAKTPTTDEDVTDVTGVEKTILDEDVITGKLLNVLNVPKIVGDIFLGEVAERAVRRSVAVTAKMLTHMKKNIKNPGVIDDIVKNIKSTSKARVDMVKNISSKYKGKLSNGRFTDNLTKRMKSSIYSDLAKSTTRQLPFKGPGTSPISKIGLKATMKATGNLAKSSIRMGLKFLKGAMSSGLSAFTMVSALVDLIDPFGFENLQSNKQYYRLKRKLSMEWSRVLYDEYTDLERTKASKGVAADTYIPLDTPMYWGPIHELNSNAALNINTPTVESLSGSINYKKMVTMYTDSLMKIIDREFGMYLENDANWVGFEKTIKNMKDHLVCAEVEDYEDVERERSIISYFTKWGYTDGDDIWDTYRHYIPKYECRAVPPRVTGAKSASSYSSALIEQNLIPYEAAFLYLQIFIRFMEKIAVPGAWRLVCESFPTKWIKNTLSAKDIKELSDKGISAKWDMLNLIEQSLALLGNMRDARGQYVYNTDHVYIKALTKYYMRLVMAMEISTSEDCNLNYFSDNVFRVTSDDIADVTKALSIAVGYFSDTYTDKKKSMQMATSSIKATPGVMLMKNRVPDNSTQQSSTSDASGSSKDYAHIAQMISSALTVRNKGGGGHSISMALTGKDKCEPSEYCVSMDGGDLPIIGNALDLIKGNASCVLKDVPFTFNYTPEEFIQDSCNIKCFSEWTDWEFIRLLNKYQPEIDQYMANNGDGRNDVYAYIDIVNDCFEMETTHADKICADPTKTSDDSTCNDTENMCMLNKDGSFILPAHKIQKLKDLGLLTIGVPEFDEEFKRLYDILISGRPNPESRKFGVCPLNYCKQNMDRIERDDELKRIMNSCMYRHKASCTMNWAEASTDMRTPYFFWDDENKACYVNKNLWQYRTLCDCATKKGNGLFGRIEHNEVEDPEGMLEDAAFGASVGRVVAKLKKVNKSGKAVSAARKLYTKSGAKGVMIGATAGSLLGSGNNTLIGSMASSLAEASICSSGGQNNLAYTCDDLTSLSGDEYNSMSNAVILGTPGADVVTKDADPFTHGKTGYSVEDRKSVLQKLEKLAAAELNSDKRHKLDIQIELMKSPNADASKHSFYTALNGNFNDMIGCKCGIKLHANTGDWKVDAHRAKLDVCAGSLGVNVSQLPNDAIDWNDENHPVYPNSCVTNKKFCDSTGGCWFHSKYINPPTGYGDCEIPTPQAVAESLFGVSVVRGIKLLLAKIPGANPDRCYN